MESIRPGFLGRGSCYFSRGFWFQRCANFLEFAVQVMVDRKNQQGDWDILLGSPLYP